MLELTVASARLDLKPAVILDESNGFADLGWHLQNSTFSEAILGRSTLRCTLTRLLRGPALNCQALRDASVRCERWLCAIIPVVLTDFDSRAFMLYEAAERAGWADVAAILQRIRSIEQGWAAEDEFAVILRWLGRCRLVHRLDQEPPGARSSSLRVPDLLASSIEMALPCRSLLK
jgi:hypothetical protein